MRRRPRTAQLAAAAMAAASLVLITPTAAHPDVAPAVTSAATGAAGVFVPAAGRLLDTRNGTGGYATPMPANTVRTVAAAGVAGIPASGVSALALTLTVVGAPTVGAISVAPGDVASPTGTALVFNPSDSVSNTDLVALHTDGNLHVVANAAVNLIIDVQGYFTDGSTTAPGGFVALDQARIVDTRNGTNVPQARVASGGAITVTAVGLGGVPSAASAVYVNIAVLGQTANGYLRTYPAGATVPTTGALGFDNTTQSESVAIPLSAAGAFTVLVGAGGPVDLIIDIQGYFTPSATTGAFTPSAVHLLDTRAAPVRTIAGNAVLNVAVAGVAGLPTVADGVAAVALNLRTVQPSTTPNASGYLRVWPSDQPEPNISSLNYTRLDTYRTDLAIVGLAVDGSVNIRNGGPDPIDVVLDVEGWFNPTHPVTPTITSSTISDGQTGVDASLQADFSFRADPQQAIDTQPVQYEYWLDDGSIAFVPADAPTITLPAGSDGVHDLLVAAIDAAGHQSDPADFSWVTGQGVDPAPPDDPAATGSPLAVITTTATTTTTNDDGTSITTTDTSTLSTPAEDTAAPFDGQTASQLASGGVFNAYPTQYPGGGGYVRHLSCAKERVIWEKTSYAQLAVRYNCHYGRGTVNWDQILAPELPGRVAGPVYEDGMKWNRSGVLGTVLNQKNAPHPLEPLGYLYHGSVDTPARNGDIVTASDFFVYQWTSARQYGTVRIDLTWDCQLVP